MEKNMKNGNSQDIDEESKLWLEEDLIPKLKIVLNQENSVSQYKVTSSTPLVMSSMIFLELRLTIDKEEENYSLVLKRPSKIEMMRDIFQSDSVFHNEILFYEKYPKNSDDYPRCFYTEEDPPMNSVIVIENINKHGYHVCPQKVNLEMKYIVAAMQEIGRFHAKAYALKHKSPREFFQIVNNIQETRFEYREKSFFAIMINSLMTRVIKHLREQNYDKVFCDRAEIFFKNAFENVMRAALNPKIPLAILCHGDFTVNNAFFKDSESGMKAMLFDFALITYGSPAIDLSTFIYLSMSAEDIRTRFSEAFDAYYDSLAGCLKEIGLSNFNEFSKERFLRDYKRYALFGYMIASFYLPVMHGAQTPDFDSWSPLEMDEVVQHFSDIGGDEFRDIFTEMLLDMRNSGCLDHIVS